MTLAVNTTNAVKGGLALLTVSYPLWVYFGMKNGNSGTPLLLLAGIGLLHAFRVIRGERASWLWIAICILLLLWSAIQDSPLGFKFYPVTINLGMFFLFAHSLFNPPSMIERFARLAEPDLPAAAIPYTRKVTMIWCGFFVINGSISLMTIFASAEAWALYNGLISYLLIGALLGGERLFRRYYRRHHA